LYSAIIGKIGNRAAATATSRIRREAIRALSDGWPHDHLGFCNIPLKGARAPGMIAPDEPTFAYLEGRPFGSPPAAKRFIFKSRGEMESLAFR